MARFREDGGARQDAGWREAEVLRLGALGAGRAEIAAALDLSLAGLAAAEAASPSMAEALERAETRALAWWEAIPREALAAGVRFNFGPWEREMRRRFGAAAEAGTDADDEAEAEDDDDDQYFMHPKWGRMPRILLPCNKRTKLRPDGTCPCAAYHNDAYWRAEEEEYYAEHPDERPEPDDEDEEDWDEDDPSPLAGEGGREAVG